MQLNILLKLLPKLHPKRSTNHQPLRRFLLVLTQHRHVPHADPDHQGEPPALAYLHGYDLDPSISARRGFPGQCTALQRRGLICTETKNLVLLIN